MGALIVLGTDGMTRGSDPREVPRAPSSPTEGSQEAPAAPLPSPLLVWAASGIPREVERAVAELPHVRRTTRVSAGLDWIEGSRSPEGSVVDLPRRGRSVPVEVAAIRPRSYARFVAPGDRAGILTLQDGETVLSATARKLRRAGEGLQIRLRSGAVRVADVVSDETTNGYEMLVAGPPPPSWQKVEPFLLVHAGPPRLRALQRTVRRALGPGVPFRIRAHGETPFLRHGDGVLPQMLIKEVFGEFSATARSDGFLDVDPAWERKNITTGDVPLLGSVTCHRALFPQLRSALAEIERSGAGFLIDRSDYGGCYSPRFINARPGARISHHAWGVAIDLNVSENAYGTKPDLDRRIVDIMESWGFTWGGRWLVPDGMHFEWTTFP